jgi:phage major head subunit gpT-like protein/phage head maturation protease
MPKQKKLSKEKLLEQNEFGRAQFDTKTINKENRSVDILISTESPLRRVDFWSGEAYDEVLLHGEENIDLTRAANAKLRWMHGSGKYGELPLGKLENVRIENKELRGTAHFSSANPDADMFWKMVEEGTLSEISVGGKKQDVRITQREGDVPLVEVVRWEFQEASLVDIGADPKAGIGRSENFNEGDIMDKLEILRRELDALKSGGANQDEINRKIDEVNDAVARVASEKKDSDKKLADLQRREAIRTIASEHAGLISGDELNRALDDSTIDEATFTRSLLAVKVKKQNNVNFQRQEDTEGVDIKRAVSDGLIMRFGGQVENPHADAHKFTGASMLEIARAITSYDGFDKEELIQRAMSTSDFPVLLSNVANKMLDNAFTEAEATFDVWTQAVDVKDFKQGVAAHMQAGSKLQKVAENGELKNIEFGEHGETFKLESYGAKFRVTRQMLINDDLGAFQKFFEEFGSMARRSANSIVYDLLQGRGEFENYKMSDDKPIFDATTHKNYDATGAVIATDSLTSARTKMRRQEEKGVKLNITPKYLLVSPENETKALQLLTSESDPSANNSGVTNVHRNTLDVVVDSELEATPWFLAAPRRTIKVLYLQGTGRKPIVRESDRNLSGVTFECVFDFGVYAEDFRGLYKNAGA